jgi:hypothetical protein
LDDYRAKRVSYVTDPEAQQVAIVATEPPDLDPDPWH